MMSMTPKAPKSEKKLQKLAREWRDAEVAQELAESRWHEAKDRAEKAEYALGEAIYEDQDAYEINGALIVFVQLLDCEEPSAIRCGRYGDEQNGYHYNIEIRNKRPTKKLARTGA